MYSSATPSLALWRDLTPLPQPLVKPQPHSKHVLIIGGGVIGLTTSWVLLDQGFKVTIISKEWASFGRRQRLASQVAGTVWEYPHTHDRNSKRWCMDAYRIWNDIAAHSSVPGVKMVFSSVCFLKDDQAQLDKMKEIRESGVAGFTRGQHLNTEHNIYNPYGTMDAYSFLAPTIDTDATMAWLMYLVKAKGAVLHTETIRGDLSSQELELRRKWGVDVIVNCTGIGSVETASDNTCYPSRGAFIHLINDGIDFPKVDSVLTIRSSGRRKERVVLVPRNDNTLLLGAVSEPDNWHLNLTLDSPVIQRMRARCELFLPFLRNARVNPSRPLSQGLRPSRQGSIRVERESVSFVENNTSDFRRGNTTQSRIIHSYGHGDDGWTLAFGCAGDVSEIVKEVLGRDEKGQIQSLPSSELPLHQPPLYSRM
ncbi:hypothetical protein V5O48_015289 [Marasmius crinis-equi]|uniref:FAD dependent oxidoreductase domain-containing protein n=1 Tax=Marasmius crinis-equi TaxID=585013 RepID=A0ABR3EUZ1_9AGAR